MNRLKQIRKNYNSPTPDKWKRISDIVLAIATCLSIQVPLMPIDANAKTWVVIVLNAISVAFKFGTKFTTNEEQKNEIRHYNNGSSFNH